MVGRIPVSALLAFGTFYPLLFLTQYRDQIKGGFYRFQLGLTGVVLGLGVVATCFMPLSWLLKSVALCWLSTLLVLTGYYWSREPVNEWLIALPSVFGIYSLLALQQGTAPLPSLSWIPTLLGGLILAASVFCMNLGHWYLNAKAIAIRHLTKATVVFGVLLLIRLLWDLFHLRQQTILFGGYEISAWAFMGTTEGVFLALALVSGTLLPLITIWFVLQTLKVRATESATGLLYVILVMVLIGEFSYRYYRYGYGLML